MEEKMIPFYAHEAETARLERTIKRLWILCILIFLCFVGSNGAWIWYESQFMDVQTAVAMDAENGVNNYIGNDGDIYNGENDSAD